MIKYLSICLAHIPNTWLVMEDVNMSKLELYIVNVNPQDSAQYNWKGLEHIQPSLTTSMSLVLREPVTSSDLLI